MDICKAETTDNKDFTFNLPVSPAASDHQSKGAGECRRDNRNRKNDSLCYGKRATNSLMKCTVILSQVLGGPRESPNGKTETQNRELSRGSVYFFMLHQHVEY